MKLVAWIGTILFITVVVPVLAHWIFLAVGMPEILAARTGGGLVGFILGSISTYRFMKEIEQLK